jgi:hypothetical protein
MLPAAMRSVGYGEVNAACCTSCALRPLSRALQLASSVSSAFEGAMGHSLRAGYSPAQLQPLQRMWDSANGHRHVIHSCWYYFALPGERDFVWRAQWSDSDSD